MRFALIACLFVIGAFAEQTANYDDTTPGQNGDDTGMQYPQTVAGNTLSNETVPHTTVTTNSVAGASAHSSTSTTVTSNNDLGFTPYNGGRPVVQYTECFKYFLEKDRCVIGAEGKAGICPPGKPPQKGYPVSALPMFQSPTTNSNTETNPNYSNSRRLVRRYDDNSGSGLLTKGHRVCGFEYSDEELGVCLWDGASDVGGWVSASNTINCNKQVYLQRQGDPKKKSYYARILDSCPSLRDQNKDPGCFQIAVTPRLFEEFNPSDEERKAGRLFNLLWDFEKSNAPQ